MRENGAWLGWIETYWTFGLEPGLILEFDALVESLTEESLADAARTYLDTDQYVLGILSPEDDPGGGSEDTSDEPSTGK